MFLLCRLTAWRSHILRCGAAVYSLTDSLSHGNNVGQAFLPWLFPLSQSCNGTDKNVCPPRYSARRAMMGSTRDARRAGT